MKGNYIIIVFLLVAVLIAVCMGPSWVDTEPTETYPTETETKETNSTETEQIWELINNPLFQVLYPSVQEITITNQYTKEVVCQIDDPETVFKLQCSFNIWSFESAATESMDTACMYLISFDDKLVIEYAEGHNYCRIDNKPYLLPMSFWERICEYIPVDGGA